MLNPSTLQAGIEVASITQSPPVGRFSIGKRNSRANVDGPTVSIANLVNARLRHALLKFLRHLGLRVAGFGIAAT